MGCCGSRLAMDADDEDEISDIESDSLRYSGLSVQIDPSNETASIVGGENGFHMKYSLGEIIGKGASSIVHKARNKETGLLHAVKCISKEKLNSNDLNQMVIEVQILAKMKHPNIVHLYDFYIEEHFYYIVMDYMEGGELFKRLVEKTYYTQQDAKNVIKTILETISYCHDKGIAHRDLKPENILLTSIYDDASVKLADFGLAIRHYNTNSMTTRCGSPLYLAPEILDVDSTYGKECDIWSIGVITFMLLSGCPPFYDDNLTILYEKIQKGHYDYDPYYWKHVSTEAKTFISRMLVVDPAKRATADELLHDEWLQKKTKESSDRALTHAIENLKTFNARGTLLRAINTVQLAIAIKKKPSETNISIKIDSVDEIPSDEQHEDCSSPENSISSSVFESYHFTRQGIDPRDGWASEATIENEEEWL